MDYDNTNFIRNSGTSFYLIVIWALGAIVTIIMFKWRKANSKFGVVVRYLISTFFFSFLIRTILETYIDLLISIFLNIK